MSFLSTLPLASRVSSAFWKNFCPAPSATTITACVLPLRKRRSSAARSPFGPSMSKSVSGMRQKFTTGFATAA